jgi:hypothetical protein
MARTFGRIAVLAALLSAGCTSWFTSHSEPDNTPAGMSGTWVSASSTTSLTNICTHVQWTIVNVSGSTGSGAFTATCGTNLLVIGTANATLNGENVTWTADGTGTSAGGGASCAVTLNGTGTFDGNYFRLPYTGTACGTPVSGTEILKKSS